MHRQPNNCSTQAQQSSLDQPTTAITPSTAIQPRSTAIQANLPLLLQVVTGPRQQLADIEASALTTGNTVKSQIDSAVSSFRDSTKAVRLQAGVCLWSGLPS
jgi:ribulose kinase